VNPQYIVTVMDIEDKQFRNIWLKNLDELQTFLQHVDKDAYVVGDIQATELLTDWKDFCKKETTLEQGNNGENK
jgi:hypothetical protein